MFPDDDARRTRNQTTPAATIRITSQPVRDSNIANFDRYVLEDGYLILNFGLAAGITLNLPVEGSGSGVLSHGKRPRV